jgi:hypothetical protein
MVNKMRAISLADHNIVGGNDCKSGEISDSVPGRYAFEVEAFGRHLAAIAEARDTSPLSIFDLDQG